MKRILAFVALLSLVTMLFVGCTKKDDNVSHNDNGMITEESGKKESTKDTRKETHRETESQRESESSDNMTDSSFDLGGSQDNGTESGGGENGGTDEGNGSSGEDSTMPERSRGIRRF